MGASNGPNPEEMTYVDFVVKKKMHLLGTSLTQKNFMAALDSYFESLKLFLQVLTLLDSSYSSESDIEEISDDCIVNFVEENAIESFPDLYLDVANAQVKMCLPSKRQGRSSSSALLTIK